jgi:hypothetical protein
MAGASAPASFEAIMKVQFENGYEAEMRDEVAKVYIAKGKVKQVKEKQDKPAPKPARPAPKQEEKKDSGDK